MVFFFHPHGFTWYLRYDKHLLLNLCRTVTALNDGHWNVNSERPGERWYLPQPCCSALSMMVPGRFQLTHFPGLYITHGSAFLCCIDALKIISLFWKIIRLQIQSLQLSLHKAVSDVWPQWLVKRAQRVPVRFQWLKSQGVDQLVGQQIRNKLMGCNIADQVIASSRIFLNDLFFACHFWKLWGH